MTPKPEKSPVTRSPGRTRPDRCSTLLSGWCCEDDTLSPTETFGKLDELRLNSPLSPLESLLPTPASPPLHGKSRDVKFLVPSGVSPG